MRSRPELPEDYQTMLNILRSATKEAITDSTKMFNDTLLRINSDISTLIERTSTTNKEIDNLRDWQDKHTDTHNGDRKHTQKMLLGISSFISGVVSIIVATLIKVIKF